MFGLGKQGVGMGLLEVKINTLDGAPIALHNYPCPIYYDSDKAVYVLNRGYFQPSWAAQADGYKIVKADNWIRKLLLKLFFKNQYEI